MNRFLLENVLGLSRADGNLAPADCTQAFKAAGSCRFFSHSLEKSRTSNLPSACLCVRWTSMEVDVTAAVVPTTQRRLSTSPVTRRTSGSGDSSTPFVSSGIRWINLRHVELSSVPPSLHPSVSFVCSLPQQNKFPLSPPPRLPLRSLSSAPCWREMSPPPPFPFFFVSHTSFVLHIFFSLSASLSFPPSPQYFFQKQAGVSSPFPPTSLLFFFLGYFSLLFLFPPPPFSPSFTSLSSPACHYPLSPTALCPSYLSPSGASTCGDAQRLTGWHCATEPSRTCEGNITRPF